MVKNIPCPNCGTACPDTGPNAREDGTQLILKCPNPKCRRQFIVHRQKNLKLNLKQNLRQTKKKIK